MGQEISNSFFSRDDFEHFSDRLRQETQLLHDWIKQGELSEGGYQAGFELEAWLLDPDLNPTANNEHFLDKLANPMAVPELAQFNFELNGHHRDIRGKAFTALYQEMAGNWSQCQNTAEQLGLKIAAIGTLPTARLDDFNINHMSQMQRYRALNQQVLRMREGKPLSFKIQGKETLDFNHPDVMLEAATTSFQIHLRMPLSKSVRLYNAGKIVAGPMTALTANSPYFLGKDLWAESRIPIFEQSVQVGQSDLTKRVSFGIRYANESIMEVFDSNLARYPIMLPEVMDEPPESLAHLRLHNGTIWRWNRPLVGFDEDGTPHFRLEHRCVPSGPSLLDSIANAAFFYGIVAYLAETEEPYEKQIPFHNVRDNFYHCAYHGYEAEVLWLNGRRWPVMELLSSELVPKARQGLLKLQVDESEISFWLEIIQERVAKQISGAVWQRRHVARGASLKLMLSDYLQNQASGLPVDQWDL